MHAAVAIIALLVAGVHISDAADRHWQTGTWKDMGIKRDPWVGGVAAPLGTGGSTVAAPVVPEVGTYVIETSGLRLELEDTSPLGPGSFDASVTIGASVTFALNRNVAYIRDADGIEHRLKITRRVSKAKR